MSPEILQGVGLIKRFIESVWSQHVRSTSQQAKRQAKLLQTFIRNRVSFNPEFIDFIPIVVFTDDAVELKIKRLT